MFLSRENYTKRISQLVAESDGVDIAVAFLGGDAVSLLSTCKGGRLICNLESGATNPESVQKLIDMKGVEVRTLSSLHAKIFLGNKSLICGSANLSANGLGFEDDEAHGWEEAGILSTDNSIIEIARRWFDGVWDRAVPIDETALENAKANWASSRSFVRSTRRKFSREFGDTAFRSTTEGDTVDLRSDEEEVWELVDHWCPDLAPLYTHLRTKIHTRLPHLRAERESGGTGWVKFTLGSAGAKRRQYAQFGLVLQKRKKRIEVWFKNNGCAPTEKDVRAKELVSRLARDQGKSFFVDSVDQIDDDVISWLVNAV